MRSRKYFYGGGMWNDDVERQDRGRLLRAGLIGSGLAVGSGIGVGLALRPWALKKAAERGIASGRAEVMGSLKDLLAKKTAMVARSREAGIEASIAGDVMRRAAARKAAKEAQAAAVAEKRARRQKIKTIKANVTRGELRKAREGYDVLRNQGFYENARDFSARRAGRGVKEFRTMAQASNLERLRQEYAQGKPVGPGAASGVPEEYHVGNRAVLSNRRDHMDVARDAAIVGAAGAGAVAAIHQTGMIRDLDKTSRAAAAEIERLKAVAGPKIQEIAASATRWGQRARRVGRFFVPGFGKNSASPLMRGARKFFADGPGMTQTVMQDRRRGIGPAGATALLAGGLGAGVAGGMLLSPGVRRSLLGVRRSVSRGVGGVKKKVESIRNNTLTAIGERMRNTTEIYNDIGRIYRWGKSSVGGGIYNLLHPANTWREIKAGWKAGLAGQKTYPTAKRPAWALSRGRGGRRVKEFVQYDEAGIPFTGVLRRDIYVKQKRDDDILRGASAYAAGLIGGGAAGYAAGTMLPTGRKLMKKAPFSRGRRGAVAAGAGALAGGLGVLGVRKATLDERDIYGERPRLAKAVEFVPGVLGAAGVGLAVAGGIKWRNKLSALRDAATKRRAAARAAAGSARAAKKKGFWKFWNRERGGIVKEFAGGAAKEEKKKNHVIHNPYVGAAASGGASGAILGMVPMLRRGAKFLPTAKGALGLGAMSSAIVGGGAYLGSKIIGEPKNNEGAPFTKRAAMGGAIAGGIVGGGGILVAKKIPGAAKWIEKGAEKWVPLHWIHRAGTKKAALIGAGGGAIYGGASGADEGQQVDSIRNMRKDIREEIKKSLATGSRRRVVKMLGYVNQPRIYDETRTGQYNRRGEEIIKRGHMHGRFADPFRQAFGIEQYQLMPNPDGTPSTITQAQYLRSFYRRGKDVYKWGGRGTGLINDSLAAASGKPRDRDASGRLKKREWEKAWFRNAVGAAAGALALGGSAYVIAKTPFGKNVIQPKLKAADDWLKSKGWHLSGTSKRRVKEFGGEGSPRTGRKKEGGIPLAAKAALLAGGVGIGTVGGMRLGASFARRMANRNGVVVKAHEVLRPGTVVWREAKDPLLGRINHYGVVKLDGSVAHFGPKGVKTETMAGFAKSNIGVRPVYAKPGGGGIYEDPDVFSNKAYNPVSRNCQTVAGCIAGTGFPLIEQQNTAIATLGLSGAALGGTGIHVGLAKAATARENRNRRANKQFDWIAEESGWDVRDPRGRSARIFAPGHQRRQRREAEWHETKEGQRKLLIGAGVAGALGVGALGFGGGYLLRGWKAARNLKVVKAANEAALAERAAQSLAREQAATQAAWEKRSAASKLGKKRRKERLAREAEQFNIKPFNPEKTAIQ